MPPAGYPAFLQYLQSGRVRNFGRRSPVGARVWVVAAVAHPKIGRPTPVLAHQLASAYIFPGARELVRDKGERYAR